MKVGISKEWFESRAALEDGLEVGAGNPHDFPHTCSILACVNIKDPEAAVPALVEGYMDAFYALDCLSGNPGLSGEDRAMVSRVRLKLQALLPLPEPE